MSSIRFLLVAITTTMTLATLPRLASAQLSSPVSSPAAETSSATATRATTTTTTTTPAPASREAVIAANETPSLVPGPRVGYWTVGFGPFLSRRLGTDKPMYGLNGGYLWDLNPAAAVKVIGEAAFSSGNEGARFFNIGAGGNWYVTQQYRDFTPYLTADIGYGSADDAAGQRAEGFSVGAGAGMQFFRTEETTMDLLVRYATILERIESRLGNPQVIGARLAVNF